MKSISGIKPLLFIASSGRSVPLARALKKALSGEVRSHVWTEGLFHLSQSNLQNLLDIVNAFDFGVFILAPDDILDKKGKPITVTRDNVIFECGLFYGAAGASKTFLVAPGNLPDFEMPSDLFGISYAPYKLRKQTIAGPATVAAAAATIIQTIRKAKRVGPTLLRLNGRWKQEWSVTSPSFKSKNTSMAEVLVVGDALISDYTAKGERYHLRGQIGGNRVVTGKWTHAAVQTGYHGTFQLEIAPDGRTMTGVWLGWSVRGGVNSGQWVWIKQ